VIEEEIFALAKKLGQVPEEDERLRVLCRGAEAELRGRLRDGVSPRDCGDAFLLAGAWLALAGLAAGQESRVERFTAGDVSVQMEGCAGAPARQAALQRQARRIMAPYLQDEGFAFRRTPG